MPSIRIWTLESDNDAKAVKCLANKLIGFRQHAPISIQTAGRRKSSIQLKKAIQNFLKQDDCVIIVVDRDGPRAHRQRLQNSNSLINQIRQIEKDSNFVGKVFLVEAIHELEAWLLIDCIGVFCYFATKRAQHYRNNCRGKVLANISIRNLVNSYQKGDTEEIVGTGTDGKGAKEYLIELSEKILSKLNPKLSENDIKKPDTIRQNRLNWQNTF